MSTPIYLDYMATTPVDNHVIARMVGFLGKEGVFANPSSTHFYGLIAQKAVEEARYQVAETVNADPKEIIFTSGATEAINLAILGAARFYQNKGRHLITVQTEHKAVLDSFGQLEKEGFSVTYLPVDSDGLINQDELAAALRRDTILVSIMHVNNETGVIQDIAALGEQIRARGIIFHVDGAQSAGKLAINLKELPVDLMSFSAHKNYGPKGVGALFIRSKPRIRLLPQTFGGGQEASLRSGTLATHQIVGMGEAFALGERVRCDEQQRILCLREQLWQGIKYLPGVKLNGHSKQRVSGNLSVSFPAIEADSLMLALQGQLAVSTSAACASARTHPSYVLRAMGLSAREALSTIRFSIGRFTTTEEITKAITIINTQVSRLYDIVP